MNQTVVFPDAREVAVEDRDRPEPSADEVLIETDTSLISAGTECTVLSGDFPEGSFWDDYAEFPFDPGYANVGTIAEVGDDATTGATGEELEVGTRVATWTPHAEYVTAAAGDCVVVPDDVDDEQASLFAIAQIVMNGVRRGRVDWGETVVVYGLGILGQLAVRFARLAGADVVVGVDLADQRLEYLPDAPEVVGVNPTEEDPAEAVERATGGDLADVCFEVTGNPDVIPQEFDVLREQARLVLLSSPHGKTTLDFHDHVNAPSHEIIGAHQLSHAPVATPRDPWTKPAHAELFFSYLEQGRLSVADLFSHVEDAADAPAVYDSLLGDRSDAMAVRLEW
ncbi:hypothetical protein L593_05995 [Salinarchaeum sp. Harcht-Bsk1]|uniref:zinc-dependent alcohol dehydrogenase n=1 Tax=Salinarchaeum sp. Harcht-Bsk1 TaxID=1333523 RepID=UPI00034230D5|nr:zinc-binding alcohol dehydrogenase [Salinarchaeum sp. Harcht-Bsk1]AGN01148.1 hypothetical protein L593_05995 [Salinarchaeum sp. Harcht-Bsk1]